MLPWSVRQQMQLKTSSETMLSDPASEKEQIVLSQEERQPAHCFELQSPLRLGQEGLDQSIGWFELIRLQQGEWQA